MRVHIAAAILLVLAVAGSADATKGKPKPPATIAEAVAATPELSVLLEAVLAADPAVLKALSDPKAKLTVFAPTNDAFVALLAALKISKADLLKDKKLVTDVLLYHALGARVLSSQLKRWQYVQTLLAGKPGVLKITKSSRNHVSTVRLYTTSSGDGPNTSTRVTKADIKVGKSVVHLINKVLIPGTKGF